MPTASALLVGLTSIDPAFYRTTGTAGIAGSAANVARMQGILTGFTCTARTKPTETTADKILADLQAAADALQSGDIFVFYFAGHGMDASQGVLPGTLVAYDKPIQVADIKRKLQSFRPGVRIVVICDSCYAGDMQFLVRFRSGLQKLSASLVSLVTPPAVQSAAAPAAVDGYNAQLIVMAAANSVVNGGQLTNALLNVWNAHQATRTYLQFYCAIAAALNGSQSPIYMVKGPVSDTFEDQIPFTVATPAASNRIVLAGIYSSAAICAAPPPAAAPSPPIGVLTAVPTPP